MIVQLVITVLHAGDSAGVGIQCARLVEYVRTYVHTYIITYSVVRISVYEGRCNLTHTVQVCLYQISPSVISD